MLFIDDKESTCVGCRLSSSDKSGGSGTVLEYETRLIYRCEMSRTHVRYEGLSRSLGGGVGGGGGGGSGRSIVNKTH